MEKVKRFESTEGNVWKYVFTTSDSVVEAVLYKYQDFYKRTVICCSTQSGCMVGCAFCGTGRKFIRNMESHEIVNQITTILKDQNIEDIHKGERFQIMFMSMGEPMHNWAEVKHAIYILNTMYPNAELLLSTIGVNDDEVFGDIIETSKCINKVGLQFSIHKSNDEDRNKLIPYKDKMSLTKIRDAGLIWYMQTGRKPYLNYCVDGTNNSNQDYKNMSNLFSPVVFNMTFSVVCSANESMKDAGYKNISKIEEFTNLFLNDGYNTRIFDPSGQDDIGGGCGQLWYVQQWIKENNL